MGRLLLTAALLVSLSATVRAEIINGDFETGDLTGWNHETNGPTATVVDTGGNHELLLDVNNITDPFGTSVIVYQEFSIPGPKPMLLSFDYRGSLDSNGGSLDYFFGVNRHAVSGSLNVNGSPPSITFEPTTFSTELPPGTYTVGFGIGQDIAFPSGQVFIDNVRLTPVPEPSTVVLLLVGILAIGVGRRWRGRG